MIEKTTLSSGVDIPFTEAQLTVHPPRLEEIAMINESEFFIGCDLLNTKKKDLKKQGNFNLENITNFDIIMSVINEKTKEARKQKETIVKVLSLLFPGYQIQFLPDKFLFIKDDQVLFIDATTFDIFQSIITDLFMLDKRNGKENAYNPANAKAQAIIDKINKGKEKIAKQRGESNEIFLLGKYADILSIGLQLDRNILNKYTVWQIYNLFDMYIAKVNYDMNISCRLAGATKVEEIKNWMQ